MITTCLIGVSGGGRFVRMCHFSRLSGTRSYTHWRQDPDGRSKCHRYALGLPITLRAMVYFTVCRLTLLTDTPSPRFAIFQGHPGALTRVPPPGTARIV